MPPSLEQSVQDAMSAFRQAVDSHDLEAAFEATERMISHWPDSPAAWTVAGLLALELERLDDACYRFASALSLAPYDFDAHYNMALAEIRCERFDAALNRFRGLRRQRPDSADLLNDLGVVYRLKRQPARAFGSYRRALKIDPNNLTALDNAINLCVEQNWSRPAWRTLDQLQASDRLKSETEERVHRWREALEETADDTIPNCEAVTD